MLESANLKKTERMKIKILSGIVALAILFSSCIGKRVVTSSTTEKELPPPVLRYDEFIDLKLHEKPFTITEVSSGSLGTGSVISDVVLSSYIVLTASIAFLIYPSINAVFGAYFLGGIIAFPICLPFVFMLSIEGKETKKYRNNLKHLSFLAIEEVLQKDARFTYIPQDQITKNDSMYSIQIKFDYTYIGEDFLLPVYIIDADNHKIKDRVESPNLRIFWTIISPDGEELAKIETSNRYFINEPSLVYPRKPEFQDSYIELASQSAESFLSLLKGEADMHVPTSPLAILKNTDARIIMHRPIGQYSFTSLRDRLISSSFSKNQYLVEIDRGAAAGYEENKKYDVFNTSEEYDLYDNNYYTEKFFTHRYFLRDYKRIGVFETLLVKEDISVGVFRPLKTFERILEKPDQIHFDDLIIRIHNPYSESYH